MKKQDKGYVISGVILVILAGWSALGNLIGLAIFGLQWLESPDRLREIIAQAMPGFSSNQMLFAIFLYAAQAAIYVWWVIIGIQYIIKRKPIKNAIYPLYGLIAINLAAFIVLRTILDLIIAAVLYFYVVYRRKRFAKYLGDKK